MIYSLFRNYTWRSTKGRKAQKPKSPPFEGRASWSQVEPFGSFPSTQEREIGNAVLSGRLLLRVSVIGIRPEMLAYCKIFYAFCIKLIFYKYVSV